MANDFEPDIGAAVHVYVPNDDVQIDNGYTDVRIFWASSRFGSPSQETDIELVAGQKDYEYVKSDALETDYWEWCLFGSGVGEGPRSERMPVGPQSATRKAVRQEAGKRLGLVKLGTVLASPSPTTTEFASTNLIDADASDFRYTNQLVRFTSGDNLGEVRRIRNQSNSGYDPATGTLTANAFGSAPSAGDTFEIWRPKGHDDTSEMVDDAINRIAGNLWWQESFYFTVDDSVSEYTMPARMHQDGIQSVTIAQRTYPNDPDWRPVPRVKTRVEGGRLIMNVMGDEAWGYSLASGDVIKVEYLRHGDPMDDDGDRLYVPVYWAGAEAAMSFLDQLGTPSGGMEQVVDAERAKGSTERELNKYRSRWMPTPAPRQELAR